MSAWNQHASSKACPNRSPTCGMQAETFSRIQGVVEVLTTPKNVITVSTLRFSRKILTMRKVTGARDIKLIAVGNSRGIRLPKTLLQKYGWSDSLVLEETAEGIFLHGKEGDKLSWKDTYQCMALEHEDWNDLDVTVADGLD